MKLRILFCLMLTALGAYADTPTQDFEFLFNRIPGFPGSRKYQFGTKAREMHTTAICVYDFPTQGGALGKITLLSTDLKTNCSIPGKAVVRNGFVDSITSVTPVNGAIISISTGNATADFLSPTGVSPLFVTNGSKTITQFAVSPLYGTLSTYLKLPLANPVITGGAAVNTYNPYINITGLALTAGHFRVFFDYTLSE